MMRALDLISDRRGRGGERVSVRHFENSRDAAEDRAVRTAFQVFLVGQARLTEMNVAVDHLWQEMQAAAVDHLTRGRSRQVADDSETAGVDTEVTQALAVVVDDRATLEDQVVAVSHSRPHAEEAAERPSRSMRAYRPDLIL